MQTSTHIAVRTLKCTGPGVSVWHVIAARYSQLNGRPFMQNWQCRIAPNPNSVSYWVLAIAAFAAASTVPLARSFCLLNILHIHTAAECQPCSKHTREAALFCLGIHSHTLLRTVWLGFRFIRYRFCLWECSKNFELTHSNSVYERLRVRKVALIRIPATQQQTNLFTLKSKRKIITYENRNFAASCFTLNF